ncbi:hypothetical protein [Rhodoferax sp.]|uniref:hypothetical protein n=1 Tax=Rhodoferax sp. TaxID=50421 RepID=UPI0039B8A84E
MNPSVSTVSPSVIYSISEVGQAQANRASQTLDTGKVDAAQTGSSAAAVERDWTIRRPEPEKVEDPPPVPISKLLLEFLQSMWRASGTAVEVAQAQNQNLNLNPNATPGQLIKEELTYTPSKVSKTQNL